MIKRILLSLLLVLNTAGQGIASNHIQSAGDKKHYICAQDNNGLVGQWSLGTADVSGATVYGQGVSDNLTAVASPTLTTGFDGRANQALAFNGTTQYLTQKVHDTMQGTVTASMVDGTAFINDSGQDFSPYVGVAGVSKPYMLVAVDTGGKVAWGYIGEEGTGETLGSELLTNGDFSSWTGDNPDNWTVSEGGGANIITQNPPGKCQILSDGGTAYVRQDIFTANKLYKYYLTVDTAALGSIRASDGTSFSYFLYSTTGNKTGYLTANNALFLISRTAACNITIDDVSIKQVLTLPANTGVKIYSARNGSTQSWANVETGFNANAISSYEIRKTDFQITGAMTLGAWIKSNSSMSGKFLMSKYDTTSNYRSWGIRGGTSSEIIFSVSDNGTNLFNAGDNIALNDNVWHFVVGVYSPSSYVKIFVDGVLKDTNTTSIPASLFDTSREFLLGAYQAAGVKAGFFPGSIDEPFIMNISLTADQVLNLYNSQKRTYIQ